MNTVPSLAGTGKAYVKAQLRVRFDEGTLHIQAIGKGVNRGYGLSTDISLSEVPDELVAFIKSAGASQGSASVEAESEVESDGVREALRAFIVAQSEALEALAEAL